MIAHTSDPRNTRRSAWLSAVAVAGLVAGTMLTAGAAFAILPGSTFEGSDGNLIVNATGKTDWENVAGLHTGIDQPSGSADNAFGQGTKEDNAAVTVVDGSIPPNKNDLTRFYEASEQVSGGDIFLYLGWERLVNIGNANLDFEINQNETTGFTGTTTGPVTLNRTAGDLLVTYDFGGSGTPTLGLLTWLTAAHGDSASDCYSSKALPCWGKRVNLTAAGDAEGAVNTATISEPIAGGDLTAGLFGEAAINLTDAGVFQPGVCQAFGSTFLKSRSSSSFTAEIKDFIAPIPVSISNCGSITIKKVTENGDSTFGYTTTNLDGATASLKNGETKTFSPLGAGTYSVTENITSAQTTAGWTLKSLSCTPSADASVSGSTATITLGLGDDVTCTFTNHINLSPTIATTLSTTTANIGDNVHDSATLTGATSNAGGTVTYHAYAGQNTCTGTDLLNSTKTVTNGVVPDSASVSFTAPGYYSFQAVYSGDANNNGATSDCTTEQLLVKTNPSIETTLSQTVINLGSTVYDTATLKGATSDAGGTVTYHAYAGADTCSGTDLFGTGGYQVTVTNGVVPDSSVLTPASPGDYSFQAVYSGDSKNNGATSVCSTEQLLVMANPTIATTLSATTANIGDNVHDSATLSSATANAGGTVTYHAYAGQDTCTGTDLLNSTKTVTNGVVPDSDPISFASAGYYSFQAVYSGDTNNNGATSICSTEQLLIETNPSIATTLSATSVDVGSSVHDSATLTGATSDAGGTVTYTVYSDNACTTGATAAGSVNVTNGVVPDSNALTFNTAGTYYWQAVYSGDTKNNGATSTCTDETLVVNKLQPSVATTQDLIPNDSFVLSGGFSPTGSITFNLYSPADASCSGTPALTQTVTVNGNGTYSTSNTTFHATTEGTWRWASSYTGDGNNLGVGSACGVEQFTIANH